MLAVVPVELHHLDPGFLEADGDEHGEALVPAAVVGEAEKRGGTGGAQNLTLSTGNFAVQSTWSNDGAACLVSHAVVANVNYDYSLTTTPASVTVAAGATATVAVSSAVVSGTVPAINLTTSAAPAGTTVALAANSIAAGGSTTLTIKNNTAAVGTYTITVTNLGPSTASNVAVTDTLPTNVVFVSASSGGTLSNGIVSWPALATLANA